MPDRQNGVVLFIALIILVALSLAGIALIRSVDTANVIAGNLAFQQAATQAGEAGTEAAISSFLAVSTEDQRMYHKPSSGYRASTPASENPLTSSQWDYFWRRTIDPNLAASEGCNNGVCKLPSVIGYSVSYVIQRLCKNQGDPMLVATGCSAAPEELSKSGNSEVSGQKPLPLKTQYYYRVTTRIAGPRNTVSYIQTIVAK